MASPQTFAIFFECYEYTSNIATIAAPQSLTPLSTLIRFDLCTYLLVPLGGASPTPACVKES